MSAMKRLNCLVVDVLKCSELLIKLDNGPLLK